MEHVLSYVQVDKYGNINYLVKHLFIKMESTNGRYQRKVEQLK